MTQPGWEFDYAPVSTAWQGDDDGSGRSVVVALSAQHDDATLTRTLRSVVADVEVVQLLSRAPLFWWRVRSSRGIKRAGVLDVLAVAGLAPRYVASSLSPSLAVAARPPASSHHVARPRDWPIRRGPSLPDPETPGRWFLRAESGIAVDRAHFGSGQGTRLAVIDDEADGTAELDLDAEVLVHLEQAPRATLHGATMVALAVGTRQDERPGRRWQSFRGVAPHASPRLYCIPKPSEDLSAVPTAIVRAVSDGADVVVCASYLDGTTSPMLDDALDFAVRYGRGGKGTAVIFPVGRETSSPRDSVHASLSLALGDPASDPRAFAIGPSGREGGWFFWRDRKGRLRPFANRGPFLRWLAPGDDLVFPFARTEMLGHAESSGASAIAAGVALLVLAANRSLRLGELDAILTSTTTPVRPDAVPVGVLADRHDTHPLGIDRDGHNAKHGYGRLDAGRACMMAADPLAAALVAIGEDTAARRYSMLRRDAPLIRKAYSRALGRFLARAFVANPRLRHASKALARHLRGTANHEERRRAHVPGSLLRQLILVIELALSGRPVAPRPVATELRALLDRMSVALGSSEPAERTCYGALAGVWR
ncbi:MAG TPA: S8 family serine peptidase [Polyangiaceae bacterium]|nr:S8 family serine peptidase [Polyangiaceae bacterium]